MNLTVSALESMSSNCREVIDSGILACHEDRLREVKALNDEINSCFRMVNDLTICKESLEQSGYSQQWLDIINKDNKFLTVCNIEMPRFFGGDEAKCQACMEGVMDTIKSWLKKAWETLKKIYAFLMGCIKAVLDFYKGKFGDKMFHPDTLQKMWEAAKQHREDILNKISPQAPAPVKTECILDLVKIDDFKHYSDLLTQFANRINLAIANHGKPLKPGADKGMVGFVLDSVRGDSGNVVMDIYSNLAQLASEAGCEHNLTKDGFLVHSNRIEFLPLDAFPTEKVDIYVDTEWTRVRDGLDQLKKDADIQVKLLARMQDTVAGFQKHLETLLRFDTSVANGISLEDTQRALQRTTALYSALVSLVGQSRAMGAKLQITYGTIVNALKNKP